MRAGFTLRLMVKFDSATSSSFFLQSTINNPGASLITKTRICHFTHIYSVLAFAENGNAHFLPCTILYSAPHDHSLPCTILYNAPHDHSVPSTILYSAPHDHFVPCTLLYSTPHDHSLPCTILYSAPHYHFTPKTNQLINNNH